MYQRVFSNIAENYLEEIVKIKLLMLIMFLLLGLVTFRAYKVVSERSDVEPLSLEQPSTESKQNEKEPEVKPTFDPMHDWGYRSKVTKVPMNKL